MKQVINIKNFTKDANIQGHGSLETRPGVSSCPPGCKTSPCNSTLSIEPNFATFAEITLVESIKYNLKQPKNGPDMAPMCS